MISERIKKIRTDKGYSVNELAEKSHISASYLYQIERGVKNPSIDTLTEIAKALNVTPSVFIDGNIKDMMKKELQNPQSALGDDPSWNKIFIQLMRDPKNFSQNLEAISKTYNNLNNFLSDYIKVLAAYHKIKLSEKNIKSIIFEVFRTIDSEIPNYKNPYYDKHNSYD